jgi:hypothetical protein
VLSGTGVEVSLIGVDSVVAVGFIVRADIKVLSGLEVGFSFGRVEFGVAEGPALIGVDRYTEAVEVVTFSNNPGVVWQADRDGIKSMTNSRRAAVPDEGKEIIV